MHLLTPFQAKYYAHELTRQRPSGDMGKLTASLQDAQVDLNPHQVDAALFAFKSPLSKGAILADEVGLGKTIEAGIILAQKWAERKRRLMVICPANLRKQWSQELQDKFFLPSVILEKKSFDETIMKGNLNPFDRTDEIVICSFQFVRTKAPYVQHINWDLAIIDEAHRLRNVYKPGNKIANTIKNALWNAPKVLLTATPLQNTLLELYGLVSIIDDFAFGDIKSYKAQFSRVVEQENFTELQHRLAPICKRTLRRQVQEYINYTNRIPIVEEFFPYDEEIELYNGVTDYLQKPVLYAMPARQRQLITLILRKLLSSSTYAISGTMRTMKERLEGLLKKQDALNGHLEEDINQNYDDYTDLKDEWEDDEEDLEDSMVKEDEPLTQEQMEQVQEEINLLDYFQKLAESVKNNSKGDKLITALKKGFEKLNDLGAPQKAIIFTESTRTQSYIKDLLTAVGYQGKIVLFNGSNNDPDSKTIYQQWLKKHAGTDKITGSPTADKRQAIVDYFRNQATIMIATEAAAEGINLQFFSLVVNYDLPWNPQRIEQRIGRCHRYGQKYDVVVVNFLNKANEADKRVYQLLDEKFKLFSGVFGASDEVLGAIGSGVDFEKRIARIYQECRRQEEIKQAFDALQKELEPEIEESLLDTKKKLLENFDEEVHQRLRVNLAQGKELLSNYESMLWDITRFGLKDVATFHPEQSSFVLNANPFADSRIHHGPYYLIKAGGEQRKTEVHIPDDANIYRVGHPLAQEIITTCKNLPDVMGSVAIHYTNGNRKISALEPYLHQSGWLRVALLSIDSFEREEYLLMGCMTNDETPIPADLAAKLLSLPQSKAQATELPYDTRSNLDRLIQQEQARTLQEAQERNAAYYNDEIDKLDKWADDMKLSLEKEIKDLEAEIKLKKAESRKIPDLAKKVHLQREIKDIEKRRNEKRKSLFEAQDDIDERKEQLLNNIEARLQQQVQLRNLFTLHWQMI